MNQFDLLLELLLMNRTAETLYNVSVELAIHGQTQRHTMKAAALTVSVCLSLSVSLPLRLVLSVYLCVSVSFCVSVSLSLLASVSILPSWPLSLPDPLRSSLSVLGLASVSLCLCVWCLSRRSPAGGSAPRSESAAPRLRHQPRVSKAEEQRVCDPVWSRLLRSQECCSRQQTLFAAV